VSNILTIAYTTERTTDQRFLESIILKVFEELAFECEGVIEVYNPLFIKFPKKNGFVNDAISLSIEAYKIGINVLCVHVDADSNKDDDVIEFKIDPAFTAINGIDNNGNCKNLVAIIPIHMTEAWMLADKDLLKEEIGTNMSNTDLGINRHPESIANPKKTIENAINIAQADLPKRRDKTTISDLYQPIGQKITTEKLEALNSFNKFKLSVKNALKKLNYLHD
jgi:hypothetical protein